MTADDLRTIAKLNELDGDDTLRPLDDADKALSFVLPWLVLQDDQVGGRLAEEVAHALQMVRTARDNLQARVRDHTGSAPEGPQG